MFVSVHLGDLKEDTPTASTLNTSKFIFSMTLQEEEAGSLEKMAGSEAGAGKMR